MKITEWDGEGGKAPGMRGLGAAVRGRGAERGGGHRLGTGTGGTGRDRGTGKDRRDREGQWGRGNPAPRRCAVIRGEGQTKSIVRCFGEGLCRLRSGSPSSSSSLLLFLSLAASVCSALLRRGERRGQPPPPLAMGDIPSLVKISVSLRIQPNDGAVYFKVDGQRFGQNRTIKLLTGAKYKIDIALRPGTVQAT